MYNYRFRIELHWDVDRFFAFQVYDVDLNDNSYPSDGLAAHNGAELLHVSPDQNGLGRRRRRRIGGSPLDGRRAAVRNRRQRTPHNRRPNVPMHFVSKLRPGKRGRNYPGLDVR